MSDAHPPPLTLARTEDDAYSMLVHTYDEKGALVDVIPSPVLGFLLDHSGTPIKAVCLRGVINVHDVALWGPEGCVHKGAEIWSSLESYATWAKEHKQ